MLAALDTGAFHWSMDTGGTSGRHRSIQLRLALGRPVAAFAPIIGRAWRIDLKAAVGPRTGGRSGGTAGDRSAVHTAADIHSAPATATRKAMSGWSGHCSGNFEKTSRRPHRTAMDVGARPAGCARRLTQARPRRANNCPPGEWADDDATGRRRRRADTVDFSAR